MSITCSSLHILYTKGLDRPFFIAYNISKRKGEAIMKKTIAKQYYDICTYRQDFEFLCSDRANVTVIREDGSKEWSFRDGSTAEIDLLNQLKIDGEYV